ncbi:MAG: DUF3164 family protein [Bacteroides graminisolvens]|uniref:DUF3164 family protein n=1 Tax=Bacteroides graminisolvens TaxID=477666 RepID=UPI003A8402D8
MDLKELLKTASPDELEAALQEVREKQHEEKKRKKDAYEGLKADFLQSVKHRLQRHVQDCTDFKEWLRGESESFYNILKEYGRLKRDEQIGFTVSDADFKVIMKGGRVKKFDERADIAEKRLVDFLNDWIASRTDSKANPMYKLAMSMIQRNEAGDLDYKSISRLYELEEDFNDPVYSEIMSLFRESNVVEGTVIYFQFEARNKNGFWNKIEPSFNRM